MGSIATPGAGFVAAGAAVALSGVALAIAKANDIPLGDLTRDATSVSGVPWYIGSLSRISIIAWASGSAVALVGSAVATRGARRGFLRAIGVLGFVLTLDDALLFHEEIFASIQPLFFVAYGLAAIGIALRYYPVLSPTTRTAGMLAGSLLALSVVADLGYVIGPWVEDVFKFAGVAAWTAGSINAAAEAVPSRRHPDEHAIDLRGHRPTPEPDRSIVTNRRM